MSQAISLQAVDESISHASLTSPIGSIQVGANETALMYVRIGQADDNSGPINALLREALSQITAWFEGKLIDFALPLVPLTTAKPTAPRFAVFHMAKLRAMARWPVSWDRRPVPSAKHVDGIRCPSSFLATASSERVGQSVISAPAKA